MGKGSYGFPRLNNASHSKAPTHYITTNLRSINRNFGMTSYGYIAKRYDNSPNKRTFVSKNPMDSARRLFRTLGRGGVQKVIRDTNGNIKGWRRVMKGGDVITYRPRESSDGSSVVDIYINSGRSGIKSQKIHFYTKESKQ